MKLEQAARVAPPMSRRSIVLGLAALVAGAGGWFAWQGSRTARPNDALEQPVRVDSARATGPVSAVERLGGTTLPSRAPIAAPEGTTALAERSAVVVAQAQPAPGPPLAVLRGRVVDELNTPVQRFELELRPVERGEKRLLSFDSDDGRFVVEDPPTGRCRVQVRAVTHLSPSTMQLVELPRAEPLLFVLERAAVVFGTVVDAFGAPVAEADVGGGVESGSFLEYTGLECTSRTDAEGRFELGPLMPGRLHVRAGKRGATHSERAEVDVAPGERRELTLVLPVGGRVTGEVLEKGRPVPKADVGMFSTEGGATYDTRCDESGRFELEHVTPGTYQALSETENEDGDERIQFATFEVFDEQTTHVVLGRSGGSILVHGRVTLAGVPQGGFELIVIGEGGALFANLATTDVDADGLFTVEVRAPGDYVFFRENQRLEFYRTIPDVPETRVELELPTGRITGRVTGPDGPLAGEPVELVAEGFTLVALVNGARDARTDGAGHYDFEGVLAGRYTIAAGGARYGRQTRSPVVLADGQVLDGIDFALVVGQALSGRVLDADGNPVPAASVFVRDASGTLMDAFNEGVTDARGAFVFHNLGPGAVSVFARATGLTSSVVSTRIEPGVPTEVELHVNAGGLLRIRSVDSQKHAVRARFSVRDEADFEHADLFGVQDLARLLEEGVSSSGRRVGPLPPGKLRVTARTADGRRAYREVTLRSGEELDLELVPE